MFASVLLSQMEEFMVNHESKLPLPPAQGEDTIFEYVVGESGEWEHWANRVSYLICIIKRSTRLCDFKLECC